MKLNAVTDQLGACGRHALPAPGQLHRPCPVGSDSRPPPQHEPNYAERHFQRPRPAPYVATPGRRWPDLALRIERTEPKPAASAPRRPILTLKGK